jgi:hypothetical protein
MNYKLIHDEAQLQKFIDFLPELKINESYFLILIARKKWNPESDIPSALKLKREAVNNKQKIIQTIRQWEVAEGVYQNDGKTIPQVNLGVYMGFNPKDQHKASFDLINQCLEVIRTNKQGINIKSMANDVIQASNGTKHFMDIDVDIKEGEDYLEIAKFIKSIVAEDKLTFIKTNGGFHCLVRMDDLGSTWYPQIKAHTYKSDLNIMSNDLIPVVGCNQGKFVPYFMK